MNPKIFDTIMRNVEQRVGLRDDEPEAGRSIEGKPRGPFEIKRRLAEPGECKTCDEMRAKGETLFPSHDASGRCESGKRNHCTCDVCF
jgi:hypothetical protein